MKPISQQPSRAELTYQALLEDICDGSLPPGTPLIQEQLAEQLGVSRQPIQQAMALLKSVGLAEDAGGRGLKVAPLNFSAMRNHYQIRSMLDQLAAGLSAARAANSKQQADEIRAAALPIVQAGFTAANSGNVKEMVRCDVEFHACLYTCSGNPLIKGAADSHWQYLRRVMGDVLRHAELPVDIWQQHQKILEAILQGDSALAESLAGNHIDMASAAIYKALRDH